MALLMDMASWVDVGGCASRWGGTDNEPNCYPNNALTPSRINYVICNPEFVPFIRSFQVTPTTEFPAHSILDVWLRLPKTPMPRKMNHQAPSLHDTFMEHFNTTHPPHTISKGEFPTTWNAHLQRSHSTLDHHLQQVLFSFAINTTEGNTNEAWQIFCKATQDAICNFLGLQGKDASKHHRRGKPHIKTWTGSSPTAVHHDDERTSTRYTIGSQTRLLMKLERILQQWADRIRKLQVGGMSDHSAERLQELNFIAKN